MDFELPHTLRGKPRDTYPKRYTYMHAYIDTLTYINALCIYERERDRHCVCLDPKDRRIIVQMSRNIRRLYVEKPLFSSSRRIHQTTELSFSFSRVQRRGGQLSAVQDLFGNIIKTYPLIYVYACICLYTCVYVCMTCMSVCLSVCISACMYVYVFVCL